MVGAHRCWKVLVNAIYQRSLGSPVSADCFWHPCTLTCLSIFPFPSHLPCSCPVLPKYLCVIWETDLIYLGITWNVSDCLILGVFAYNFHTFAYINFQLWNGKVSQNVSIPLLVNPRHSFSSLLTTLAQVLPTLVLLMYSPLVPQGLF